MTRGISIILALLLLVGLFTGCSNEVELEEQSSIIENDDETNTKDSNENMEQVETQTDIEEESTEDDIKSKFSAYAYPQNLKRFFKMRYGDEFPEYEGRLIDLNSADLTRFDLEDNLEELLESQFDTITQWPDKLPEGFEPNRFIEINKTPGLHIRELHEKGITGKGVGVAIIDYGLVVDHQEYKDNLKTYEHIHYPRPLAHFHGPMVASILAGKNVGVAPGVDLYFIASENYDVRGNKVVLNAEYTAKSIDRILEMNESLPQESKIRVISISGGYRPDVKGYKEYRDSVNKAKDQGIFIVSSVLFEYNERFHFRGLSKNHTDDPNDYSAYTVYPWDKWVPLIKHTHGDYYVSEFDKITEKTMLLIPFKSLTTASATGPDEYSFIRDGGWSAAVPYISGLYALSCQVKPDITPEEFWDIAYETGITKEIDEKGIDYEAKMVIPIKLIEKLQELNQSDV